MDYGEMVDALIEQVDKEKIGRLIVKAGCPYSFGLSDATDCETDQRDCPDCWARALGIEEAD